MHDFIEKDVVSRFLKYVTIDSTSYPSIENFPSSEGQMEMGRLLAFELTQLGAENIVHDGYGYVYADIPGSKADKMTLCAHVDTSDAEPGKGIAPLIHKNYDGLVIRLPQGGQILDPNQIHGLKRYIGSDIITSSGDTLLGADDKAGVAEIMTLLAVLKKYPELSHPPLSIVFTPEEEAGKGTRHIDLSRLGSFGYTLDIGEEGEINDECFDAWVVTVRISGVNMHPGYSYNKMGNAAVAAGKLVAMLPHNEAPDTTKDREGFYHVSSLCGEETKAEIKIVLRDFEEQENLRRIGYIEACIKSVIDEYPKVSVNKEVILQYGNMKKILDSCSDVVNRAEQAVKDAGMTVIKRPIRGGTDGALITENGVPMPNIFNGGMNAHSITEWIAVEAMQKAVKTLINLCRLHS